MPLIEGALPLCPCGHSPRSICGKMKTPPGGDAVPSVGAGGQPGPAGPVVAVAACDQLKNRERGLGPSRWVRSSCAMS